jgi:hypothetical protein
MFVAVLPTVADRPDAVGHGRLRVLVAALGAWPWYVACLACFVTADRIAGWPSLIPLTLGLGFGLYGLTSYGHGRDGLSKYRQ